MSLQREKEMDRSLHFKVPRSLSPRSEDFLRFLVRRLNRDHIKLLSEDQNTTCCRGSSFGLSSRLVSGPQSGLIVLRTSQSIHCTDSVRPVEIPFVTVLTVLFPSHGKRKSQSLSSFAIPTPVDLTDGTGLTRRRGDETE